VLGPGGKCFRSVVGRSGVQGGSGGSGGGEVWEDWGDCADDDVHGEARLRTEMDVGCWRRRPLDSSTPSIGVAVSDDGRRSVFHPSPGRRPRQWLSGAGTAFSAGRRLKRRVRPCGLATGLDTAALGMAIHTTRMLCTTTARAFTPISPLPRLQKLPSISEPILYAVSALPRPRLRGADHRQEDDIRQKLPRTRLSTFAGPRFWPRCHPSMSSMLANGAAMQQSHLC